MADRRDELFAILKQDIPANWDWRERPVFRAHALSDWPVASAVASGPFVEDVPFIEFRYETFYRNGRPINYITAEGMRIARLP